MTTATLAEQLGLGGDYPSNWMDFIGQDKAKRQLLIACRSAKVRGEAMDHVFLRSGKPGVGKTTLALLVAAELGSKVKIASGKIDALAARLLLADMGDRDVLFIDEIHQLVSGGKTQAEWLLHLLQDGCIMGPFGPEEQPKITVVGATTDAGRLQKTILDRFIPVYLADYTDEEAARIVVTTAARMFPSPMPMPSEENCYAIARAANNNPREVRRILIGVRDLQLVEGELYDGKGYDLTEALDLVKITPDGLNDLAQRYLIALLTDFGGRAGERPIMSRLQEPGGLRDVEAILVDKGLIAMTDRGRTLTQSGIRRAKELV